MIPQYPMQKLTVSDYIEIGTTGYRIGVDSANNAIKVYKEDGSFVCKYYEFMYHGHKYITNYGEKFLLHSPECSCQY